MYYCTIVIFPKIRTAFYGGRADGDGPKRGLRSRFGPRLRQRGHFGERVMCHAVSQTSACQSRVMSRSLPRVEFKPSVQPTILGYPGRTF